MPPSLRVLVADDQAPFRNAARTVLEVASAYDVVGEVRSGEEAVAAVASLKPDLVIMDVKMEGIGGVEATRQILSARPGTLVVLVSSYRSEDLRRAVAESGALAFVEKDRFSASTLEAILSSRAEAPPPTGTRAPP